MALCGTVRRRTVAAGCIGAAMLVIGIGLIPIINVVVDKKVKESVILKEGSLLYDIWKNMSIPVYIQFYMFDITNVQEVKDGDKPYLKQKGPYTYREERFKVNITHNPNGTVSYRQIRRFKFVPSMSVGNESDEFTTINPPLLTLLTALRFESDIIKKLISLVLSIETADLFITRPMKEIVWGYTDPLLKIAKSFDPEWFYTDYVGYFINKNDTDDGLYNVFTGETDIHKLGVIDKYNHSSLLNYWTTPWANMVNGSDGTIVPPFVENVQKLPTFSSDVCRSVYGIYTSDVKTPQGIPLQRYTGTKDELANTTLNPDNIGFCTPQTSCFGTGVLNVSVCQTLDYFHIPGVVSFPHFYLAEDKYVDGVDGMSPSAEEHQTAVDVEPLTGLVLQAAKRLQINMHIDPVPEINCCDITTAEASKQFNKIKPVVMPIFWVNESAVVDDAHAEQLQNMLFTPLLVTDIIKYGLIGLGAFICVCALLVGICYKQKPTSLRVNDTVETDETKPLLYDQTFTPKASRSESAASNNDPPSGVQQNMDNTADEIKDTASQKSIEDT